MDCSRGNDRDDLQRRWAAAGMEIPSNRHQNPLSFNKSFVSTWDA